MTTHPADFKEKFPERDQFVDIHNTRVKSLGHTYFHYDNNCERVWWGTNEMMRQNMVDWKMKKKEGKIVVKEHQRATFVIAGKNYYTLTVQALTSDRKIATIGLDQLMSKKGLVVHGAAFWFTSEENRDATIAWVNGE